MIIAITAGGIIAHYQAKDQDQPTDDIIQLALNRLFGTVVLSISIFFMIGLGGALWAIQWN